MNRSSVDVANDYQRRLGLCVNRSVNVRFKLAVLVTMEAYRFTHSNPTHFALGGFGIHS